MSGNLLVIIGAGASCDCKSGAITDSHDQFKPPLTKELFELRPAFTRILREYRFAQAASADLRPELSQGAMALEAYLRNKLRDSPHAHLRAQFRAIPLYLQHLLFDISSWDPTHVRGYTAHADNYDRLIGAALELDEVLFITLNYDTILDQHLATYRPIRAMESYIEVDREPRWSLIKLHGSVNWGRQVRNDWQVGGNDPYLANTFSGLGEDIDLAGDITLRLDDNIPAVRMQGLAASGAGGYLYYPALSAPLGSGDEIVCPPSHVEFLKEALVRFDELRILVIGYSGLDDEVLTLVREAGRPLKTLYVVSENKEAAASAARAIMRGIGNPGVEIFDQGFSGFAQGGDLRQVIEECRL